MPSVERALRPEAPRGWRADEKAGMKYEGTLRQVVLRFGKYHDVRVYSILKSEYVESLEK